MVFTNHSACVSVLSTAHASAKIARWALTIQKLNLTLKHRAGKLNCNADALSRNSVPESESGICRCGDGIMSVTLVMIVMMVVVSVTLVTMSVVDVVFIMTVVVTLVVCYAW